MLPRGNYEVVNWAAGKNIVGGYGDGILDLPEALPARRVAQIFMNFCENIAK